MITIHALLLGLLEGITEFLPISSTAHLILASEMLHLDQHDAFQKTFEVVIQLGAILSVVVLYGRSFLQSKAVMVRVITAFLPTAIVGLLLHKIIKNILFESVPTILWSLFVGGVVLVIFEQMHDDRRSTVDDMAKIPLVTAALIGLCQSIAVIPGVSRSAATIVGGSLLGLRRRTIVDFSFLLAVPTMLAASVLDLATSAGSFSAGQLSLLAVGFVTSFVVALLAIRWFLRYIAHHSFTAFGLYRMAVSVLFWLLTGF